jgi:hypothetical protein
VEEEDAASALRHWYKRKLHCRINRLPLRRPSETKLEELALLRRIASAKLPYRLQTPDDFKAAKSLVASGFVKLTEPRMHSGKDTYGKQGDTLVSVITQAGRRALSA